MTRYQTKSTSNGEIRTLFFNIAETRVYFRRATSFYELPWSPRSGRDLRMRMTSFARTAFRRAAWDSGPFEEDMSNISGGEEPVDAQVAEDEEYARRRFIQNGKNARVTASTSAPRLMNRYG